MEHLKPKTKQIVIHEDKLEEFLQHGWMFRHALNNESGKVIVEKA